MANLHIDDNCFQCWLCQNRVGSDWYGRPECKVTNMYMTYLYSEHCYYFKPTEKVKDLVLTAIKEGK